MPVPQRLTADFRKVLEERLRKKVSTSRSPEAVAGRCGFGNHDVKRNPYFLLQNYIVERKEKKMDEWLKQNKGAVVAVSVIVLLAVFMVLKFGNNSMESATKRDMYGPEGVSQPVKSPTGQSSNSKDADKLIGKWTQVGIFDSTKPNMNIQTNQPADIEFTKSGYLILRFTDVFSKDKGLRDIKYKYTISGNNITVDENFSSAVNTIDGVKTVTFSFQGKLLLLHSGKSGYAMKLEKID